MVRSGWNCTNRDDMSSFLTRRSVLKTAMAATALSVAAPMINIGRYQAFAAAPKKYSARTLRVIERTLVIDMLAPLKLTSSPTAYPNPLTGQEAAMFRTCDINACQHSTGTGGPQVVEETLQLIGARQGF